MDDVLLVASSYSKMERKLKAIESWAWENQIVFSTSKTKIMMADPLLRDDSELQLQGHALEVVDSYKYLGVWLSSPSHTGFDLSLQVCHDKLNATNGSKHSRTGQNSPLNMLAPFLKIHHLPELQVIQNKALRALMGSLPSTHQVHLECAFHLPPLASLFQTRAANFGAHELLTSTDTSNVPIPCTNMSSPYFYISQSVEHLHGRTFVAHSRPPDRIFQTSFVLNKSISPFKPSTPPPDVLQIFSDGGFSPSDGSGTIGFCCIQNDKLVDSFARKYSRVHSSFRT
eukprot:TRINITY_DN12145_c0_g2_i4.p1 TRINITY_DN12145_c0_g2~~TRINITY_DN12145_c0_g2_i4.p1  ORF type:complete len:285 (+),score=29.62 TRINITY_DN12145_c0_g2_i4:217-1071(+)